MNKMKAATLIICYVGFFLAFKNSEVDACLKKFKRTADLEKFTKECFNKAGFKEVPSFEVMSKPDFDDKCAVKCVLRSFDLIDDEGRVDSDGFLEFLDENAPKPLLLKLTESSTSCAESSEVSKIKGTKKGTTPKECNSIRNFYTCFIAAADKFC